MNESTGGIRRRGLVGAAASAALSLTAVAAIVAAGPVRALSSHLVEDTVAALAWAALAASCAVRRMPFAIPLTITAAWSIAAALNGWTLLGGSLPIAAAWVGSWMWAVAAGLSYTVGVLQVARTRAARPLAVVSLFGIAVMTAGFSTRPSLVVAHGAAAPNPLALPASDALAATGSFLTAGMAFVAAAVVAAQMTSPARRRRMLPVVAAALVGVVGISAGAFANEWAPLVQVLTVPLLPVAIAVTASPAPHRAVRSMNRQLDGAADPARALTAALAEICRDLALPGMRIETEAGVVASVGVPGDHRLPLVHLGRTEGHLRTPPLSTDEAAQVDAVAPSIAAVLASSRLIDEVRRSRAELAVAREEERRRVRRDLHDEVGPLLSAIVVQTDVASMALDRSPGRARDSIDKARGASGEAVVALRRIVRDLHPLAVDGLGLVGALDELALRLTGDTAVVVTGSQTPVLPAAVEVALYRIAAEAAGNAVRHASATTVRIGIHTSGGALVLTVVDDGCGFDPASAPGGVGLASMRDRAEELAGALTVASDSRGTVLRASIPVPE